MSAFTAKLRKIADVIDELEQQRARVRAPGQPDLKLASMAGLLAGLAAGIRDSGLDKPRIGFRAEAIMKMKREGMLS